jgi:hypothetical protein
MPNHYFYILDKDFGPLFIKCCSYYPAKLCLNGHEWLKRQLTQREVPFEPLDNGIRSSDAPGRVQRIADTQDVAKIDAVFRKWLRRLPRPFAPSAVSQGRLSPPDRNHHQRHVRFRDRSCAPQSARLAGDRLDRQPTVVTRRISEPRLPDRRRPPPRRHVTRPRRRSTRRWPALRRPSRPRAHARALSLCPRAHGLSTSGTPRARRVAPESRAGDLLRRIHDLRPSTPALPRPHRACAAQSPVSHHRDRRTGRHVLCPALHAGAPARLLAATIRIRPRPARLRSPRSPISWRRSNLRPENLTQTVILLGFKTPSERRLAAVACHARLDQLRGKSRRRAAV